MYYDTRATADAGSRSTRFTSSQQHIVSDVTQDKFDRFEAWLLQNGARFDHLELRAYNDCESAAATAAATAESMSRNSSSSSSSSNEEKKEVVAGEAATTATAVHNSNNAMIESEMRGVHAVHTIPPNTVCMSIPRRCLITVEMGQATAIGQAILNSDLDLDAPKHIFLMIFILWDRKVNGRHSFFWPYYEILPKTLHNMPIFWNADELAELDGSYLQHQIADRCAAIAQDYYAIRQVAPELTQICTLPEFQWARMCVCSRNFGLCVDGHRTSALVPHADMLNHYRPRATKWTFDEATQSFTITTLQEIAAGAEVLDSYGQKCNHRFLLNYGFAVEDNREPDGFCPNEVPVELSVNPHDPLYAEKLEFWTRGEPHTTSPPEDDDDSTSAHRMKRVRVCVSNNENTRLLFSLLRALSCSAEELRALTSSSSSNNNNSSGSSFQPAAAAYHHHHHRSCRDIRHPISLSNEQRAMQLLLDTAEAQLQRYPTTLQQDELCLQNDIRQYPKFSNKRHAKIQVHGEKVVLHHFCELAKTALTVLSIIEGELVLNSNNDSGGDECCSMHDDDDDDDLSFDEAVRKLENDATVHHTIARYCADVLGSLRREEFKTIHRRRQQQQQYSNSFTTYNNNR